MNNMKKWSLQEARADYRTYKTCKNCEFFYGEYYDLYPMLNYEECEVTHKQILFYWKAKICKYFTPKEV